MLVTDIPIKFTLPFAENATAGFRRTIPVTSPDPTVASQSLGFPPDTGTPIGSGGTPPNIQDENGAMWQATGWDRWFSAGGPIIFDPVASAAWGGYPLGAIVASAATLGVWWYSTVDGNTTNPDLSGAGWIQLAFLGGVTGDIKPRADTNPQPGWALMNATTIGNASSNATQRANADTFNLFVYLWANFSNAQCPVLTSGGAPSTRGVSAAADFAANKQITVLDVRGTGLIGVDTMLGAGTARLAGVPIAFGGTTIPGSGFGENLHALILAELAAHGHGVNDPGHAHGVSDPTHAHSVGIQALAISINPGITPTMFQGGATGTGAAATGISIQGAFTGISIQSAGSNTAHNTVHFSMGVYWWMKL